MKVLYEKDGFCECYISDDNVLCFEMNACGIDLRYSLSGHPYEPVIYAECSDPRYSFNIHGGLWFPSVKEPKDSWGEFCKDLGEEAVKNILYQMFASYINTNDVLIGEYVQVPDKQGCFIHKGSWYIYETDEHANSDISGPFDSDDIIGALSVMLHLGDKFENYRYSDAARSTYIHSHYRSIGELP